MSENTNHNPNVPQGEGTIPEQASQAAPFAAQPAPEGAAAQQSGTVPPFSQAAAGQPSGAFAPGAQDGSSAQSAPVPPCAQQAPQPFPQSPALVPQLTGGLKFGYFALGFLGNLLGVLVAWLINADKHPAIRNSAIKWSVVGFACTFVVGILISIAIVGFLGTIIAAAGAGAYTADPSSFSYYGTF